MGLGWVLAVVTGLVSCAPKQNAATVSRTAVAASSRPFESMPIVALADHTQSGPLYRVQIAADITRDVMPTDDLAIVISVNDLEVGRYPIVGRFERRPTRIKQEIELPLGDYEIDYVYKGEKYAGMPFRLAEVPVWGGRKVLQLRAHPGTRVSLREGKLWIGRWWANDGPPQAWIIEWVHEGKVATATSGRDEHGIPPHASRLVGGAAGAFRASRVVQNTIWTYGEEYPVPAIVAQTPGAWAARVVHGGAAPVAVVFTVQPDGQLAELSKRRVLSAGWQYSWSSRLELLALSVTEVDRLAAKLPQLGANQPFDDVSADGRRTEDPVRISTAGVRALFRSRELAEAWWTFYQLNKPEPLRAIETAASFPDAKRRRTAGLGTRRATAREAAEKRAKLRTLRAQIEQLIKAHGGPWKTDEFPRS